MNDKLYSWTVIGAGPAGIAAVGLLLDHGIQSSEILWLDPSFKVGDLGEHWYEVSSNTTVSLFTEFLNGIEAFEYEKNKNTYDLNKIDPTDTCKLRCIVEPLQWVTSILKKKVASHKTTVAHLTQELGHWSLTTANLGVFNSQKIILATGSTPKSLNYDQYCKHEINITDALKPMCLEQQVDTDNTIAVFGSSHSAMIVIRDLLNIGIKKVINFYQSPIKFSVKMDNWILYDNTGLKGETAKWAREHMLGQCHNKINRYLSNDSNVQHYLPECDKVIYAVGFTPRTPISMDINLNAYDRHSGIIAPGLFGTGIGFPRQVRSPMGHIEMNVGLWKFMQDMRLMMPIWLRYGV